MVQKLVINFFLTISKIRLVSNIDLIYDFESKTSFLLNNIWFPNEKYVHNYGYYLLMENISKAAETPLSYQIVSETSDL